MDFPEPDAPTSAVLVLELNLRLRFESTGASGRDG